MPSRLGGQGAEGQLVSTDPISAGNIIHESNTKKGHALRSSGW